MQESFILNNVRIQLQITTIILAKKCIIKFEFLQFLNTGIFPGRINLVKGYADYVLNSQKLIVNP